jgi:DNA repair protein RadD
MELRPYQREAIDALWTHVRTRMDNPCVVLPTGAGKGVLLAQIAKDVVAWKGRLVILAHVKELLEQTYGNIRKLAPEVSAAVYSAGLGVRGVGEVTVAGIQSVYDKAKVLGRADIIAIDEAHRIPPDGEGMYRTFLDEAKKLNPDVRLVGLTATPYRLQSGMICAPENLLNRICFDVPVRKLIQDGYLSPLKSKATVQKLDTSKVSIRGGEFVATELQLAMLSDPEKIVMATCEIAEKTQDRKSILIFATGIDHANQVAGILREMEIGQVRTVFGDTPSEERARTIQDFREGRVKYLVNVEVLTTGFDAPAVDCVAILRPTMSPGLFYQMCGRGFRLAPGKADCLILDFGGNLARHGPVDRLLVRGGGRETKAEVSPWKECPDCLEIVPRTCDVCPDCGARLPRAERGAGHEAKPYEGSIISEPEEVESVSYTRHEKVKAPGETSVTLRVSYVCGMQQVSEFICLEHTGFAREKAVAWWKARSDVPAPRSVDEALEIIYTKGIREPRKLVLEADGKYLRPARAIGLEMRAPIQAARGEPGREDVAW